MGVKLSQTFISCLFVLSGFFQWAGAVPTATEIIRRSEEKNRGNTAIMKAVVKIQRSRFVSTIYLESWDSRMGDKSFTRILKPKKDRGVTFLKIGDNLWNYIPKIGREIRIEGSLLQDSWMGSDFTNDDLVKASTLVSDYHHTYLKSENGNHVIELTAKAGKPIEWKKIIYHVRQKDDLPVRQDFYDHRERLSKRMDFSNYERKGGRVIPTLIVMKTIENKRVKSQTSMQIIEARFNENIPEYIFSKANLRK